MGTLPMTAMSLKLAGECIEQYILSNTPVFLWGPPGIGKTSIVQQVAKKLSMGLIDIRLSLRDPVDLRGLPMTDLNTGKTRWLTPAEMPYIERDGERGILFLDEANTATQAMQSAAMGLVLDRKVGDYHLPPGWLPIAAGNRLVDKAAAQRMGTALRNRFAHIEVAVDLDAWCGWAKSSTIDPLMIAFLRYRQELLHKMPTGDENAFPTPRAWEQAAKFVASPESVRQKLITGLVGEGPAQEFEAFARLWKQLPSIGQIIENPKSVAVPDDKEPAVFYAIASALARRATPQNFANILEYAARIPKEFCVSIAVDAVKRDPELQKTAAFAKWAVSNSEIVI